MNRMGRETNVMGKEEEEELDTAPEYQLASVWLNHKVHPPQ